MKVGLIGFGSIGKRHYVNLKRFTQDIVVLSKRKDVKSIKVAHNWRSFVKKGPYDIFFVTNETYKHVPTILRCLPLKPRAIFVEKPLSHNTKKLDHISKVIKKDKISLWVGYNFHFFHPFIYIKKWLKTNKLGKIYYLRVFVGQNIRQWRDRDYKITYSSKREQGGGVVLDLIHDINYPSWMLGENLMPRVSFNRKISSLKINCEDFCESIFTTQTGAIVSVHQDYLGFPGKRSLEIVFEKGSLSWDSKTQTIIIETSKKTIRKEIRVNYNEMYVKELEFFFDNVIKREFFTNLGEAIRDIHIVEYIKKL